MQPSTRKPTTSKSATALSAKVGAHTASLTIKDILSIDPDPVGKPTEGFPITFVALRDDELPAAFARSWDKLSILICYGSNGQAYLTCVGRVLSLHWYKQCCPLMRISCFVVQPTTCKPTPAKSSSTHSAQVGYLV